MTTCLIADASAATRSVATRIVADLGFDVIGTGDGAEALAISQTAMPDAVLLADDLAGPEGLDLLQTLRERADGRKCRIVLLSTCREPARLGQALQAGADDIIIKPFDAHIIAHKLGLPSGRRHEG